jgi:glutathione S-transferase
MILIGMFDSPFVRRVAITLNLLEMPFEHRNWSIGKDFDSIRQFNPLGRVPTLVRDDGVSLIESGTILDYLDEQAGPDRALLPGCGEPRREALRIMAIASGAAEKGVLQVFERVFRPLEKRHEPWVARCRTQMEGALLELDRCYRACAGDWPVAQRMTQADITTVCVYTYLNDALGVGRDDSTYPALAALARRCEKLPAFSSVRLAFDPPSG